MAQRHRSPAYPAITIDEAVERARTLFSREGKHAALATTAASHWGYKAKSSGGLQTIASLKAYGLLTDEGSGSQRKVSLSEDGLTIVRDEREVSPERDQLIAEAAFRPKIISEMWERFGTKLPSEDTVKHFLVVDLEYNPSAVSDIIRAYQSAVSHRIQQTEGPAIERPVDDNVALSTTQLNEGVRMRQDNFTLEEGTVSLQWPGQLSRASYDDIKDWLEIIGRKMERAVLKENKDESDAQ